MCNLNSKSHEGMQAHVLDGARFVLQSSTSRSGGISMNALDWLRDRAEQPIRPVYAVFGDDRLLDSRSRSSAVVGAVFPGGGQRSGRQPVSRAPRLHWRPFWMRSARSPSSPAGGWSSSRRPTRSSRNTGKTSKPTSRVPVDSGILLFQIKQWLATTNLAKLVDKVGLAIDCSGPRESRARRLAHSARDDPSRRRARSPTPRTVCWWSWSAPRPVILASEVEKLAVYAGESKRIERDDVAKLVGAGRVETIWKTLDAALAGQGRLRTGAPRPSPGCRRRTGPPPGGHERQPAQAPPRRAAPGRTARSRRSLPDRRHPALRRRKNRQATRPPRPEPGRPAPCHAPHGPTSISREEARSSPGRPGIAPGPPRRAASRLSSTHFTALFRVKKRRASSLRHGDAIHRRHFGWQQLGRVGISCEI